MNLDLREKIGQLGFVAALSGFRAMLADVLFIEAHVAWERTEWGRVLFLFRQVTTLQPHVPLFWDMAAWHMAWNASAAAMNLSSFWWDRSCLAFAVSRASRSGLAASP